MKEYTVHIRFPYDESDFVISAPDQKTLRITLRREYESGEFKKEGSRNTPYEFVRYVCEKNGWEWRRFEYDEYFTFC